MIRVKANGTSMMIISFVMLIVECILICIDDLTAAFSVAITMFLYSFIQILLICCYQGRYRSNGNTGIYFKYENI